MNTRSGEYRHTRLHSANYSTAFYIRSDSKDDGEDDEAYLQQSVKGASEGGEWALEKGEGRETERETERGGRARETERGGRARETEREREWGREREGEWEWEWEWEREGPGSCNKITVQIVQ